MKPRFSETHETPGPTLMRNRLEGGRLGVESSHSAGVLVLIEGAGMTLVDRTHPEAGP